MELKGKISLGAAIATVAAIVTIGSTMGGWSAIGWETPNQHNADVLEMLGEVKDFRDEWACDEIEEELLELLRQEKAGDDSVETKERIRVLRDRKTKYNCDRFED